MSFPHVDLSLDLLWFMLLDLVSGCLYLSVSLHRVFLAWINASFTLFGIWTDLHMSCADLYFCCVQSFISLLWTQKQKESVKELCEEHFILCTPEKKFPPAVSSFGLDLVESSLMLFMRMVKTYPTVSAEYSKAVEKARQKLRALIAGMLVFSTEEALCLISPLLNLRCKACILH